MDLKTAMKTRRSIRKFKSTPIADELISELLDLANAAPSAGNAQARDFIVVRDLRLKDRLCGAALGQQFIKEAPVVIVVCANRERSGAGYGSRGSDLYCIQDADAAVMHILLSAHASGLGTCWVGAYDDDSVCSILQLPEHVRPIAIIPIGYPAHIPDSTSRIKTDKLVHIDKW